MAAVHYLLRPPPPPSPPPFLSSFVFLRPICTITTTSIKDISSKYNRAQLKKSISTSSHFSFSSPFLFSHYLSTSSFCYPPTLKVLNQSLSIEQDIQEEDDDGVDGEIGNDYDDREDVIESGSEDLAMEERDNGSSREGLKKNGVLKVPNLTVKEKKELASYAHGLGKKLKCQLVGKSGVTDNLLSSFIETLEANELLKIKIHRTCPGELEEVVQQLEQGTGSVVVGQIGRTVIVYRPSVSKLKAEEKRRQPRRVFVKREPRSKPESLEREQASRFSKRGRQGGSRFM